MSLLAPGWLQPAALTGAIFYGLAGINHALHAGRTPLQNVAMITDVLTSLVLAGLLLLS